MITSKRVKRRRAGPVRLRVSVISIVVSGLVLFSLPGCLPQVPRDPVEARRELQKLGIKYDGSAFVTSAKDGNKRAVELFLNARMDPNVKEPSGATALMEAAHGGHCAIVSLLLARGADVSLTDNEGVTALHRAADGPFSYPCLTILLDHGASPHAKTITGETPLAKAVLIPFSDPALEFLGPNYIKTVKALLGRGADANARYGPGFTPLMRAAIAGNPEIIRLLLDHGADTNAKSNEGKSAQAYARQYHHEDIARMLDGSIN